MIPDDRLASLGITVHKGEPRPLVREGIVVDGQPFLAFPSAAHRDKFVDGCKVQVAARCQDGARAACAVKASQHCNGPMGARILRWLGLSQGKTWQETEACQDAYMQACQTANELPCQEHAANFCDLVANQSVTAAPPAPSRQGRRQ